MDRNNGHFSPQWNNNRADRSSCEGVTMSETLRDQLIRHEGERLKMYLDSLGIPTIGVGHNLRDKPISKRASGIILEDDIQDATNDLLKTLPWTANLDWPRKAVLINMCFNMGLSGLLTFKNTLSLIEQKRYLEASENMLKSKWATQVGKRAIELSEIMKTGEM